MAFAAGPAQPGNPDPLTDTEVLDSGADLSDPADNLVTDDERQLRVWQFAIDDVQIRAANRARRHAHEQLARASTRHGHFDTLERPTDGGKNHRTHDDKV